MIARAHGTSEFGERSIGLDRDPAPACEIERERDVVVDRVPGADVDVEAVRDVAEAAPEMKVLETLRVGQRRQGHAATYPGHRANAACAPQAPCRPHRSAART